MKITNPEAIYIGGYGDDLTVANAARVSFHKHKDVLDESDEKLIKYLARNKHHSPFNHSFLSFKMKAPIFTARQLQKHRFMPWNEVSRRYVDDEPEFYFPEVWRSKADNVKQGSSEEPASWIGTVGVERDMSSNLSRYKWMLQNGVCPEQARMVLPQNTMTEWVWSGTLGAFLDMLVLRLDAHTQMETRLTVQPIAAKVKELFPISYKAYIND